MTPEKWQNILGNIKDKFEIEEEKEEHLEEQGGMDVESVVFNSPLGKVKLEFISKPVVLDKKTNYSRRIGSDVAVEYVYSEEEKTHSMNAYKWDDSGEDWVKIDPASFAEDEQKY